MRNIIRLTLFLLLLIPLSVSAQSADDLISQVNALRASYGLEPYTIDVGLMSLAQAGVNWKGAHIQR